MKENKKEKLNGDKANVVPRLFAIASDDGWNQMFWNKEKAQNKIDTEYKKDFPNQIFWVEEVVEE